MVCTHSLEMILAPRTVLKMKTTMAASVHQLHNYLRHE